jgi:hypothetical protein
MEPVMIVYVLTGVDNNITDYSQKELIETVLYSGTVRSTLKRAQDAVEYEVQETWKDVGHEDPPPKITWKEHTSDGLSEWRAYVEEQEYHYLIREFDTEAF